MVEIIKAAGGVLVDTSLGEPRFLVVHRPRYDDWTIPRGKLRADEDWEQAALREVAEETGMVCETLERLSPATYWTRNDNHKKVKFWLMRVLHGEFVPNDEVDAVVWLDVTRAMRLLTRVFDQAVLLEADLVVGMRYRLGV